MGAVKEYLARKTLGDREKHNSRLFVDLCENIHIHYREYRLIFSLDEYFEFVDIVNKSTQDVRNYLLNNPDYKEQEYPTTIMVACGKDRQRKFLKNSPQPHKSAYHDNNFAIELQEEYVTDEIHVHWRDLRIALNRENFKDVAAAFTEAQQKLAEFEQQQTYQRERHPDREIVEFNNEKLDGESVRGVQRLPLDQIASYWFKDLKTEWRHNAAYIETLKGRIATGDPLAPLLVTRPNDDGIHHIVNGHHRYLAALETKVTDIEVVVLPLDFADTEELRNAESLLKKFDQKTGYEFGLTTFLNDYVAYKFNRFYTNDFQGRIRKMHRSLMRKTLGQVRKVVKLIEDPIRRIRKGGGSTKKAA